jgi:hypothetical protein
MKRLIIFKPYNTLAVNIRNAPFFLFSLLTYPIPPVISSRLPPEVALEYEGTKAQRHGENYRQFSTSLCLRVLVSLCFKPHHNTLPSIPDFINGTLKIENKPRPVII